MAKPVIRLLWGGALSAAQADRIAVRSNPNFFMGIRVFVQSRKTHFFMF
ncbi:MAG: hypothetical protein Q8R65_10190 [Polynucleobacter sp.]|nr:hypothetical protein [Polynucleobacter sp.]